MLRTAAALVAFALAPATAHATDVRVVNERGIPQAAFYSDDGSQPSYLTDADGWIKERAPGATLRVTRDPDTNPCFRNPGGAPEGPQGVTLTVPEAGPVTLTLPNATVDSLAPGASEAERWIVGQLNTRRAEKGKPPVRISAILSRVADSVARKQAAEDLSFPPPFCDVVVADWGWPSTRASAFNVGGLDANGTDPRKAWAHWSDGSVREQLAMADWNAVGVGDGNGAWTAYFANCPLDMDARCEMTADQGDASIVLPEQEQAPAAPTPTGKSPALGGVTIAARQRGKAVRLTVAVGRGDSAVAVRLRRGAKIVGKVLRQGVAAGKLPLRVALNRKGQALLKAKRSLALAVEVVVDPADGPSERATRPVKLRR